MCEAFCLSQVLSKHVVIQSPKHFAKYANTILQNINVIFVDELELGFHEECRANKKYIHGTLKIHFVHRVIEGNKCTLNVYQTSTSGEEIKSQSYEIKGSPIVGHFYLV